MGQGNQTCCRRRLGVCDERTRPRRSYPPRCRQSLFSPPLFCYFDRYKQLVLSLLCCPIHAKAFWPCSCPSLVWLALPIHFMSSGLSSHWCFMIARQLLRVLLRTPSLCPRQALLVALPIHDIGRPRSLIPFVNSMHFNWAPCLHFFFQVPITSCYNPLIIFFSTLVFTLRTSRRAKAHSAPLTPPSRSHPTAHTSKCAPTRPRYASNHSRLCIAFALSQRHARFLKAVGVVLRRTPGRLAHSPCPS